MPLAGLEEIAAGPGARIIVLKTGSHQPAAIGLYKSSGYVRIVGAQLGVELRDQLLRDAQVVWRIADLDRRRDSESGPGGA